MSAMERTTQRRSPGSNASGFDERATDPQRPPSGPSTDFSADESMPLFLSDFHGQPDARTFRPFAAGRRTRVAMWVLALVVSAFAIPVAVFKSDVTRVLFDKATVSMEGAPRDRPATQAASKQPASREDIVSAYHTALQNQAPPARPANEAAARTKTLDAETLAALVTRAKNLLAQGDIAAARLLLERAANSQDATAALLLAQTYDPAVLGAADTRSITPQPVMALDWYRKAASLGSADAQRRLTQLQK
jgi:hypothetical protein